jgi:hypothetical protein
MLQQEDTRLRLPLGAALGIIGTEKGLVNNTWSVNNIYHLWKPGAAGYYLGRDNLFANDLVLGAPGASHAAAIDAGRRIPNFNDDFSGAAPDLGARETPAR